MIKKGLYFFVLCAAPCLMLSCGNRAAPAEAEAPPAEVVTPVTVTTISEAPMTEYIELNATSAYLLKSFVKANANGYLQSANVKLGEFVNQGQALFTIKTKEAVNIGNAVNALDSTFKFTGTNHIRAGSRGFITQLNHQHGDYVQDGEQLAEISDYNSFAFLMNMPYELRPYVVNKKDVEVILPDGEKIAGFVSSAMPTVDATAQTQSVTVKVNASHPIPENLLARVRIPKIVNNKAISLPKEAILTDETQTKFWIMKLTDSSTAVKTPIKKGMELDGRVEILSPSLSKSDQILVSGNYGLPDTAKVKVTREPNE